MARRPERRAVLIAGATTSGKSALAVEKARALGGVVINTDAMQVYDVLRVLTAFSVIILPLTLIASVWGMNVHVPGEGDSTAFWAAPICSSAEIKLT